jgi:protein-tyrosine phosphatase
MTMNEKNTPTLYSYEIIKDKFYAGEYPRNPDEESSITKIQGFINFGITDFIDLTMGKDEYLTPYTQMLPSGISYNRFAIRDVHFPETFAYLQTILQFIEQKIAGSGKVYVHCLGGVDRTGVIVASWFVYNGLLPDDAMAEYKRRWATNPKSAIVSWKPLIEIVPDYLHEFYEYLHTVED